MKTARKKEVGRHTPAGGKFQERNGEKKEGRKPHNTSYVDTVVLFTG